MMGERAVHGLGGLLISAFHVAVHSNSSPEFRSGSVNEIPSDLFQIFIWCYLPPLIFSLSAPKAAAHQLLCPGPRSGYSFLSVGLHPFPLRMSDRRETDRSTIHGLLRFRSRQSASRSAASAASSCWSPSFLTPPQYQHCGQRQSPVVDPQPSGGNPSLENAWRVH